MKQEVFQNLYTSISELRIVEPEVSRKKAIFDFIAANRAILLGNDDHIDDSRCTGQRLITHLCWELGAEMLEHLSGLTESADSWGAAAMHSKEDWLKIPTRLREQREFQRTALKSSSSIYFYLDSESRKALAWDFIETAGEEHSDPSNYVELWDFPEELSQDEDFAFRASQVYEYFPFFIPEPLRSDMTFAKRLQEVSWYLPLGLFITPENSDDTDNWTSESLQVAITTKAEAQRLARETPQATKKRKGTFKL